MRDALFLVLADGDQHLLVIIRHDLLEARQIFLEVIENLVSQLRVGLLHIVRENDMELGDVVLLRHLLERIHVLVHSPVQAVIRIQHIGDASAHAGGKILAGRPENDGPSAGHILKTVVSAALRHRDSTGITDAETLARPSADISLACRGAVQRNIADDDIFTCPERRGFWRNHHQFASGEALAESVVGVSGQP